MGNKKGTEPRLVNRNVVRTSCDRRGPMVGQFILSKQQLTWLMTGFFCASLNAAKKWLKEAWESCGLRASKEGGKEEGRGAERSCWCWC